MRIARGTDRVVLAIALAAAAAGGVTRSAGAQAVFIEIPSMTEVLGISADGRTVVGFRQVGFDRIAVRWNASTGSNDLPDLPGGTNVSSAHAVSADGSVIVGQSNGTDGYRAVRWVHGQVMSLGDLPGGEDASAALGVSDDGMLIVGAGIPGGDVQSEAFFWTSGGGMVGLGFLPAFEDWSQAIAVSGDGTTIVGASISSNAADIIGPLCPIECYEEAFRVSNGGPMVGLYDPFSAVFPAYALAASKDGSVIVGAGLNISSGVGEAFFATATGVLGLGHLPGGFDSGAVDVSADGWTVLCRADDGVSTGAAVWTFATGMRDLKTLLETAHGLDLTGWRLSFPVGMSADGNRITGWTNTSPGGGRACWLVALDGLPPLCPQDISGDGAVSVIDLLDLLAAWGPHFDHLADFDESGVVDVSDLLGLLGAWGPCP